MELKVCTYGTPGVQPKIWVTISPQGGEGHCQGLGRKGQWPGAGPSEGGPTHPAVEELPAQPRQFAGERVAVEKVEKPVEIRINTAVGMPAVEGVTHLSLCNPLWTDQEKIAAH